MSMPAGTRSHNAALALPNSAHAPNAWRLITRSPMRYCVMSGPTATTLPAASLPGMNGGSGRNWYFPASISTSTYCTPRASMRTWISPGPGGAGSGTSRQAKTSGPPNASQTTAFMRALLQSEYDRLGGEVPTAWSLVPRTVDPNDPADPVCHPLKSIGVAQSDSTGSTAGRPHTERPCLTLVTSDHSGES